MTKLSLLVVCGLVITSCGQEEITFRNPIRVEQEKSVKGNWLEEDRISAREYVKNVFRSDGSDPS